MLERTFKNINLSEFKGKLFIADKEFDSNKIMEDIAKLGIKLAIRVKETFRINVKHPLRKKSKEGWNKFSRYRYLIESLFGNIKQKLGSNFRVKNQEIAKKMGLAVFVLYNMYLLFIFFFLITTLFLTIFHLLIIIDINNI